MAAASRATSVPRMPIATPTSAFLQRRRVVDAVAQHGHDLAAGLQCGDDPAACLRALMRLNAAAWATRRPGESCARARQSRLSMASSFGDSTPSCRPMASAVAADRP